MTTTETAPAIDLQPFCDKEAGRYTFNYPFVIDGWRYATNGYLCIRVPAKRKRNTEGTFPDVAEAFKCYHKADRCTAPWPAVELQTRRRKCPRCEGRRSIGCRECGVRTCPDCDEKGIAKVPTHQIIAGRIVKAVYVKLIASLPNVTFDASGEPSRPLCFKFDGGEGMVMGMENEPRDEVTQPPTA